MAGEKRPVIQSRPASDEEIFYVEIGKETFRKGIDVINESLSLLIKISGVLLSASVIFLDRLKFSETILAVFLGFLFVSLLISFIGIMPYRSKVHLYAPYDIRDFIIKAFKWKWIFLMISGGSLMAAFLSAICGIFATIS